MFDPQAGADGEALADARGERSGNLARIDSPGEAADRDLAGIERDVPGQVGLAQHTGRQRGKRPQPGILQPRERGAQRRRGKRDFAVELGMRGVGPLDPPGELHVRIPRQHGPQFPHLDRGARDVECAAHPAQRAAGKFGGFRREVDAERQFRAACAQHRRQPRIEVEAAGGKRDVQTGGGAEPQRDRAPRRRAADINGEIVGRGKAAGHRDPPVRTERDARRWQKLRQIRPARRDPAAERAVPADLPGQHEPHALHRALAVQRDIDGGGTIAPRLRQPRGEVPGAIRERRGAGRLVAAGEFAGRERRLDVGDHEVADRDPAFFDPGGDRRQPGRRPHGKP